MDYNVTYRKKDKSIQAIISYKDENGKWRQKSKQGFKAQKDAKPWIKETVEALEEQIKLDTKIDPLLRNMTFGELMKMFVSHLEVHREYGTVERTEQAWKKFESLDDIPVVDITKIHTQNIVDIMVKKGLSHNTLKNYISRIFVAFNYAIEKEIIYKNPLSKITIPEDKKSEEVKTLTKLELENLLVEMPNDKYYIGALLASNVG